MNKKVTVDPPERCSGTTAAPGRFDASGLSAAIRWVVPVF